MSDRDFIRRRQINEALKEFHVRSACAIFEALRSIADLIDEQPPAVLQAFVEFGREWDRSSGAPKHREAVRAVLFEYVAQRLAEAKERERRLLEGITGR
jgi:hypothetical protein